jgi:hypothetical protein
MREGEVSGVAAAGAAVGERPRQICGTHFLEGK